MFLLATEFPVKEINRGQFVSEIWTWINGMNHSHLFAESTIEDLDKENPTLKTRDGMEVLNLREFSEQGGVKALGFRYDYSDSSARVWRTEGVLKYAHYGKNIFRLKTQCSAQDLNAELRFPKKPYLIKSFLQSNLGDSDGLFNISDKPIWLNNDDLEFAQSIILGNSTEHLPIIYISSIGEKEWSLTKKSIEKLAYELGGIAHVAVEPNREFAYNLRRMLLGKKTPYNGSVGITLPRKGLVRKIYIGDSITDQNELSLSIQVAASNLRSMMPSAGWDWTELQENGLRQAREQKKALLDATEIEDLYLEEINNNKERIAELESQLEMERDLISAQEISDSAYFTEAFIKKLGPEIYTGEIMDRIRRAASIALSYSDAIQLESRSRKIFEKIIGIPASEELKELKKDLQQNAKDANKVATRIPALLARHGYIKKSSNNHIRLEAQSGYDGLDTLTVPKTPSERRGLKNLVSQIEKALGLTHLNDN